MDRRAVRTLVNAYAERFVRYTDRDIPAKRFVEHAYPPAGGRPPTA